MSCVMNAGVRLRHSLVGVYVEGRALTLGVGIGSVCLLCFSLPQGC